MTALPHWGWLSQGDHVQQEEGGNQEALWQVAWSLGTNATCGQQDCVLLDGFYPGAKTLTITGIISLLFC